MATKAEIDQMSIEQIKKNKAHIEHCELEFAQDFRSEYLLYCEKLGIKLPAVVVSPSEYMHLYRPLQERISTEDM